ncbi:MAG: hypothetical protein HRU18_14240 [Pseudoalteromonas sp.]|uniref:hypothetical protein n=1 Tax=Pseudoalteromonas sp. TaxID=53249 RepID=UPI001D5D3A55|nr:hypothetical protein [Pseudoalteromonas sp.]NRA79364.1 hypothetical protein [Pseudoalteromonas sp.]
MTKLLDCPVCNEKGVPVRNDAKVCSPKCRLKQWRKDKLILDNKGEMKDDK